MICEYCGSIQDPICPICNSPIRQTETTPIQRVETVKKLILKNFQSPGDIVMLTATIRDLHENYPGKFITDVRTSADQIFENNPYITKLNESDKDVQTILMEYPLIHQSNQGAFHFIHGFAKFLESILKIPIPITKLAGDIHLSKEEKDWISQVREIIGKDVPYWVIDAGSKKDFTAKQWGINRYQQVVDSLRDVVFVQIGAKEHNHQPLIGPNLINLIGKTDLRQLIRLIYHAYGVITPVSLPMHLAAAIEPHPRWKRKSRACIVIAGGREPSVWEAYTNHQFIHTCGILDCCDYGGCWKSRVVPLNDGDINDKNLCKYPIKIRSNPDVFVAKCMDMITSEEVVRKIKLIIESNHYDY